MKNKNYLLLLLAAMVLFACSDRTEVDQKTMTEVYVNIVIAEETYLSNLDSLTAKRDEIFNRFGINEEDYNYTIDSYKEDKEYWDQFFPQALAYLDSLRTKETK